MPYDQRFIIYIPNIANLWFMEENAYLFYGLVCIAILSANFRVGLVTNNSLTMPEQSRLKVLFQRARSKA